MSAALGNVTLFERVQRKRGRRVSVEDALDLIECADSHTRFVCEQVRDARAAGDEAEARRLKRENLAAVAWAGVYWGNRRKRELLFRPSGLVPIDLDDVAEGDLEALDAWPHLYARWKSAGGRVAGLARVAAETPDELEACVPAVRDGLERIGLAPDWSWDSPRLLYVPASPVARGPGEPLEPGVLEPRPDAGPGAVQLGEPRGAVALGRLGGCGQRSGPATGHHRPRPRDRRPSPRRVDAGRDRVARRTHSGGRAASAAARLSNEPCRGARPRDPHIPPGTFLPGRDRLPPRLPPSPDRQRGRSGGGGAGGPKPPAPWTWNF